MNFLSHVKVVSSGFSCYTFSLQIVFLHRDDQYGSRDCVEEAKQLKHVFILRLYMKLHASRWPLILLSRKPETQRNSSIDYLISAGFRAWSSLIMRYCYVRPLLSLISVYKTTY